MARQFTEEKFDLKFLIKAILHTEAYQRVSTGLTAASKEEYNLFIRMPVRGLTPEQLFDSVAEATHYESAADPHGSAHSPKLTCQNRPRHSRARAEHRKTPFPAGPRAPDPVTAFCVSATTQCRQCTLSSSDGKDDHAASL